jgi:hypothetical protein
MRNTFEDGKAHYETVPENLKLEFNVEFFTTDTGGYPRVDKEADIYHKLVCQQPNGDEDLTNGLEKQEKYNITVFAHLTPNLILKLLGSKLLLRDSHISAELYLDNELRGVGRLSKIPVDEESLIDFSNISLFRRIRFTERPSGKYVLKIFIEKTASRDSKKLVGFQIFELDEDKTLRIMCKPAGKIKINTIDQNNQGVENTIAYLIKDDTIINSATSDSEGELEITAPCGLGQSYILRIMYDGFKIFEEEINLGSIRQIYALQKQINIELFDLTIKVLDSENTVPDFTINTKLSSSEMQDQTVIEPYSEEDGIIKYKNLYPANYNLNFNYNQFEVDEPIKITKDLEKTINLYDFTANLKDKWDLAPEATLEIYLVSNDLKKQIFLSGEEISKQEILFSDLYAGNYTFKVAYKSFLLEREIHIPNGVTNWTFPAEFNVSFNVYDTHGSPISDARVKLSRQGKSVEKHTDSSGNIKFLIPPGFYDIEIYSNGDLIANRHVSVVNKKTFSFVTNSEPIAPYIIIAISIICAIAIGFFCYKKQKLATFIKITAILIIILAMVSPWWILQGSNQDLEIQTSTTLYMMPLELVTITETNNLTAGELVFLEETFEKIVSFVPIISIIGLVLIIGSICLEYVKKIKYSLITYLLGFLSVSAALTISYLAIREFSYVLYGSLNGQKTIEINIPGTESYELIECSWGPNLGFYLLLLGFLILGSIIFIKIVKKLLINRRNHK